MGNPNDELDDEDIVTLTLDDGSEIDCQIIAIFPVDEKSYIALLPPDEEDIYLYGYEEDEEGNPTLIDIEDDEEFEAVSDAFDELLDEEEMNEILAEEDDE